MMDPRVEAIRKRQHELMEERAERLHALIRLRGPAPVVTMGVELVLRSAFILYPESMALSLGKLISDHAQQSVGICHHCGGKGVAVPARAYMCEACWQEARDDSDEDDTGRCQVYSDTDPCGKPLPCTEHGGER